MGEAVLSAATAVAGNALLDQLFKLRTCLFFPKTFRRTPSGIAWLKGMLRMTSIALL